MNATDRSYVVNSLGKFILLGLVLVAAVAVGVGFLSSSPSSSVEAGAILALAGSVAVGIERVMEIFWLFIGFTVGQGWPFGFLTRPIKDLQTQADNVLPDYIAKAAESLQQAKNAGAIAEEQAEQLSKELVSAKQWLKDISETLPPGNTARPVLESLQANISNIQTKLPLSGAVLGIGQNSLDVIDNILSSMKDNPGRRLISLFAGTMLGMIVCAIFGADLLYAIFGVTYSSFQLGIVSTGIIVGLGSDPSHQVIRLLEEAKRDLKRKNAKAT